jgi:hypothetical protein
MVLPRFLPRFTNLEDFKIPRPIGDNFSLTVPSKNVNSQTYGDRKSKKNGGKTTHKSNKFD